MIRLPWCLLHPKQQRDLLSPWSVGCSREMGVTLTELMAVIAIMAIVASLAGPISDIITRNRVTAYTNEFLSAIARTRSEAIMRGRRVVMCKSDDSATCASTGDWEQGWIVFVDVDEDTQADTASDPDEVLLVAHARLTGLVTVSGDTDVIDYIAYLSNGRARLTGGGLQTGTISVCDSANPNAATKAKSAINLNAAGRARTDKDCRAGSTCSAVCP